MHLKDIRYHGIDLFEAESDYQCSDETSGSLKRKGNEFVHQLNNYRLPKKTLYHGVCSPNAVATPFYSFIQRW
jgi:hypothetical protein